MAPRHSDIERSLLLALGFVLALTMLNRCEYVHADDDPAHVLAVLCAGESGWSLPECTAIGETLRHRGQLSPEGMRAYSAALRRAQGRPWLLGLRGGDRPDGWPQRLSWPRYEGAWKALVGHARGIVAGEVAPVCEEAPDHFGGPMDSWRAHRAGWREVDCGHTRNAFWRVR